MPTIKWAAQIGNLIFWKKEEGLGKSLLLRIYLCCLHVCMFVCEYLLHVNMLCAHIHTCLV